MNKSVSPPTRSPKPPVLQPADASGQLWTFAGIGAVLIAIAAAIVLRFWASLDDFWLDEIWSWIMAAQLKSPLEVLTSAHHDNKHHLNTLVMYLMGRDAPFYAYRMPAVLAGIGAVLLCGWVARQWSRPAAVAATLLTGCSFLLIQYSSEARGYAYLLFFTMASFAVIQKSFESPRAIWEVLFAGCAILGFLSHLTYLFAYVALVAWSLWRKIRVDGWLSRRHLIPAIFEIAVPAGFVLFLYVVDLRHVVFGGGDRNSVWIAIAQAMSAAFGGPLEGSATAWIAIAVALVAITALFLVYRSGSDLWLPMLLGIFIVPAVTLIMGAQQWTYPRYFLVSLLFLQLLISWFLGWLYQKRYGKVVYACVLLAILGGNALLTAQLLKYGRGDYQTAVRYMMDQTVGDRVFVGSDHDFRNKTVLAFYFARAGDHGRAGYYEYGKWPPEGPEWLVLHSFEQEFSPVPAARDDNGNTYELVHVYPYAGLSGFHWALYHNTNRPTKTSLPADPRGPSAR